MYLYFDSNGYLKEFISDPAREGSQNVNKLYIFVEPSTENIEEMEINGETVHVSMFLSTYPAGTADFRLADSDTGEMNSLAFTLEDDSVYEQIPFNLKRDLKFFKYYKYYQFVKLTVPAEVLTDAGEVNCSISLIDPDTSPTNQFRFVMDTFSFKVQDSVVLKNVNITQAQYSYLLASKIGYADTSMTVDELPETGRSNVVYIVDGDVYRWNPQTSEYIWIGSTNIDLDNYATKKELESVASGSPKGTYDTVSDLEDADPNHSYIYLVIADGKWYYWDGQNWASGGVYMSSESVLTPSTIGSFVSELGVGGTEFKGFTFELDPEDYNGLYMFTYGNTMVLLPVYNLVNGTEYKVSAAILNGEGSYVSRILTYRFNSTNGELYIYQKENLIPIGYTGYLFRIKLY